MKDMKINKFLLSLLIVPTLTFVGCSSYEDTEVISPEAEASAIGTYFDTEQEVDFVSKPGDEGTVTLTLYRLNTKDAVTVPVTVTSCSEVAPGVPFCEQPVSFSFAAGAEVSTIELACSPICEFQKTYSLEVSIAEKDHPYVGGATSVVATFTVDYKWKRLAKPVILENNGWVNGGILAPVEWATNYEDKATGNLLFKVGAFYANAGIGTKGDLQFFLDKDYKPAGMFTSVPVGYDPTAINTGKLVEGEKSINYCLNVKSLAQETGTNKYTFTYDIFYKKESVVTVVKPNVSALLEFDFKTPMNKLLKK